jgi:very-short-patch-repair endonuclease
MQDQKPTRHVHPAILARARELRRPLTPQEVKLWARLRRKQLYGIKFRRQHPMDRFILDFFCYQHKLVIEIDGGQHAEPEQQAYDQARTEWLEGRGLRVIRFTNRDIDANIEGVLGEIARQCGVDDESSPRRGETVPVRGLEGGEIGADAQGGG